VEGNSFIRLCVFDIELIHLVILALARNDNGKINDQN